MALNYLLFRHEISLMRADAATYVEARHRHGGLARGYARQTETTVRQDRHARAPLVPVS